MTYRSASSLVNAAIMLTVSLIGCAIKEKDPVEDLKALIPKVQQHLNRRDLAALKGMGTERFDSNVLVIDVFGQRVADSVMLSLDRINQLGSEAVLILHMRSLERQTEARQLQFNLVLNGKWRIDSYDILTTPADST